MASFSKITSLHWFLFIYLHFLFCLLVSISEFPLASFGCHVEDRKALLDIKSALHDPSNRLASWKDQHKNCCDWYGIGCSNVSFRVTSIDLRNTDIERYIAKEYNPLLSQQIPNTWLQGRISPSLFSITYLEYVDLSYNDFQESQIPHQFSNLTKLSHLDLSFSNFSSSISIQFNNLSSLHFLDLSCEDEYNLFTSCTRSSSTKWLKGLVNLQVLRLRGIDLYDVPISLQHNFHLRDLDLSDCNISGPLFPINGFHNLSHLSSLKINHNDNHNSLFPIQLANLTSLSILELADCNINGSVPYIPQLEELDVSGNQDLHVDLNRMFKTQWPKLRKLWISYTEVIGSFLPLVSNASSLVSLFAYSCSIQGSLPSSFSNLSQLQYLDLSYNNITGTISSCITKLQHLRVFRASRNSIEGNVSLSSLINELKNLTELHLSYNRLTVVIDQPLHMYPTLRLEVLNLRSCNMKGFPTSIICNSTRLSELDLSHNNITGAIPSCLFKLKYLHFLDLAHNDLTGGITFNLSKLKSLTYLDLSNNKLHGPLPLLPQLSYMNTVYLSNNQFSGEISIGNGKSLTSCVDINLSGNKLSGPTPSSLCLTDPGGSALINYMDLSDNNLSGRIPTSIGQCTLLDFLNLGNNNLSGNIPNELKLSTSLEILQLNGNNLEGSLNFISKLQNLKFLNLANNKFGGSIPTGLGLFQHLKIISLRSNKLNGSIPAGIFNLPDLQILDLSINNLSGPIPRKMGNLKMLLSRPNDTLSLNEYNIGKDPWQLKMMINGNMARFDKLYIYSSGIDLSCNILDGTIPEQIGLLKGLAILNLSHNCLSSSIPTNVGEMFGLGSLDLSSNRLSGHIPQSLTGMDSLGFLNLSYNNLSGGIPRGLHFDTLSSEGLVFAGNELLCGYPTEKACKGHQNDVNPRNEVDEVVDREDANEKLLLYAIVAMGVAVGFWGLFLVLLLKKEKWWFPYWRFVHYVAVRITSYFLNN